MCVCAAIHNKKIVVDDNVHGSSPYDPKSSSNQRGTRVAGWISWFRGAATSTNTDHIGSNEAQLTIGGTRVDVLELKDHSHNNHMTTMSLTADTPAVAWLTSAHSGDGKAEEETIAATPEVSQDYSTPSN